MPDERELAEQLDAIGIAVGQSKSGRLLRVDGREGSVDLDEALLQQIVSCSALRELYLRDSTGILGKHVDQLAALEKLKVLDVEGSDFDDASVERLADHGNLQVLNIRGTRVTADCVTRLRKAMIGTRIIF